MGAFLYGVSLQWKLDMRSKTLLITCYIVPLLFFAIMGGIFTSVMPEARYGANRERCCFPSLHCANASPKFQNGAYHKARLK